MAVAVCLCVCACVCLDKVTLLRGTLVAHWLLGGFGAVLRVFGSPYDLAVLFSLKLIFNPEEWATCGLERGVGGGCLSFIWGGG